MAPFVTPSAKRNILIPVSLIAFAVLIRALNFTGHIFSPSVQHIEFILLSIIILISSVIMFLWALLGVFPGLVSFLVAMIFLYRPITALSSSYYTVLIMVFFVNIFVGYYMHRRMYQSHQKYTVSMEKVGEDNNLISNHMKNRDVEVSAMGRKIDGLLKIKNIADKLSVILDEDEIMKTVSADAFSIFGEDNRVMLFMVDGATDELNLAVTLKGPGRRPFGSKKGGIFDSWAFKNAKSLLVKDVKKDFRFSVEGEESRDDAVSLIIKPLTIEGRLLGVIRVDSTHEEAFTPHELRILDIIGELAAVALENSRLYRQTEELAVRDSLTGLYVHRYFMERLDEEVKRSLRSGNPFAFLMIDIDGFKEFNDEYGHIAGDAILRNIGAILKKKASAGDTAARYGGEEFAFLLLGQNKKGALKVAEEMRKKIQATPVVLRRKRCSVTVSVGVAVFPEDARLRDDIIIEADRALYKAKSEGKNKVCSK
jgi:diguanylate cyclase (GGDEF)-like protein